MKVNKFSATTSREALKKLRDAMGPDALIVSTRTVNGLVEVVALAEEDLVNLDDTVANDPVVSAPVKIKKEVEFSPQTNPILQSQTALAMRKKQSQPSPAEIPAAIKIPGMNSEMNPGISGAVELMSELRSMRGMMEARLTEISWNNTQHREPHKVELLKEMLASGFSASLSRYLIEKMPKLGNKSNDVSHGLTWIKEILSKNINTISSDTDMLDKSGVFALIGPTGVGKTTTTAKLAARCVMRHGAGNLALITTDGYRIGGYEQLRIYGKILGMIVHTVKDETDLRIALDELKNKHTVLIDTVGMSQRDRLVSEQIAMLSGENVKKLLCLNATSTGETLTEVIQSYQGTGLSGCIITKMDEAASIGAVLDAVIRQKLTLFYLSNGQRVPEDLHVANRDYLVDQAFRLKRKQAAFEFQDQELPILVANDSGALNDRQLSGVSFG